MRKMTLRNKVMKFMETNSPSTWSEIVSACENKAIYADTIIQSAITNGNLRYGRDGRFHWQEPRPPRYKPVTTDEFDHCPEQTYVVPSYRSW